MMFYMSRPGDGKHGVIPIDSSSSAHASDSMTNSGGSSSGAGGDGADEDTVSEEDPEQRIGMTIGKYQIMRLLGRGGMGSVYEGEDTVLRRTVAVKVLPKKRLSKPAVVERFLREAQVAGRLNHPNIITIYDVVHDESGCYIVMEVL